MKNDLVETGLRALALGVASTFVAWSCEWIPVPENDGGIGASSPVDGGHDAAPGDSRAPGDVDAALPGDSGTDSAVDALAPADSSAEVDGDSATTVDASPDGEAGLPSDAGSDDEDRIAADSSADAETNGAGDAGPTLVIGPPSDASSIMLGPFAGFFSFSTDCGSSPTSQTFTISNPGDAPVTWSATESLYVGPNNPFGPIPAPDLILSPSGSTLAAGESITVSLSFPAGGIPAFYNYQTTISESDSSQVQVLSWQEAIDGYVPSESPPILDLGSVAFVPPPPLAVAVINATGITRFGMSNPGVGSPCQLFALATTSQSPVPAFFVQSCTTNANVNTPGGAALTVGFLPPPDATPGVYTATFSFVSGGIFGPVCGGPHSFTATATLLAPADAGM